MSAQDTDEPEHRDQARAVGRRQPADLQAPGRRQRPGDDRHPGEHRVAALEDEVGEVAARRGGVHAAAQPREVVVDDEAEPEDLRLVVHPPEGEHLVVPGQAHREEQQDARAQAHVVGHGEHRRRLLGRRLLVHGPACTVVTVQKASEPHMMPSHAGRRDERHVVDHRHRHEGGVPLLAQRVGDAAHHRRGAQARDHGHAARCLNTHSKCAPIDFQVISRSAT